jgi:hypothetical protein
MLLKWNLRKYIMRMWWILLTRERFRLRSVVSTVMSLREPYKAENFRLLLGVSLVPVT